MCLRMRMHLCVPESLDMKAKIKVREIVLWEFLIQCYPLYTMVISSFSLIVRYPLDLDTVLALLVSRGVIQLVLSRVEPILPKIWRR